MFTRPTDLSDVDITDAFEAGWGLPPTSAAYLPVGFGSHHWRIDAATGGWFATVDDLEAKQHSAFETRRRPRERLEAALTTARALHDIGLEFVVAPLLTCGGAVIHDIDDRYVLAVYPFINGQTHSYGNYPNAQARDAVVELIVRLHSAPGSCRHAALTDTFEIACRDGLTIALDLVSTPWESGPFAEPARELLARHARSVLGVLDRYDTLAASARQRPDRLVLTHGEPHPANTITTDGGVVLIDWDTTLIAPPERDLWDLIGEDSTVADAYSARTGLAIQRDAIELYRLGWDLAEIAIYISDFRRTHTETNDTRTAWTNLQHFLDPSRW